MRKYFEFCRLQMLAVAQRLLRGLQVAPTLPLPPRPLVVAASTASPAPAVVAAAAIAASDEPESACDAGVTAS
jgi:hypothetical protein